MSITAWQDPTAGDAVAGEPLRARLVEVVDARNRHVREGIYDPAVHVPHVDRPHDHCGRCSPRLYSTAVPNLISRGLGREGWTVSGATQGTATGLSFTAGSQSAGRRILAGDSALSEDAQASFQVFGQGCPLTLAILARKVGTVTTASLVFGLADGTSYATGTRGTITEADLTTDFERFYVLLPMFSALTHSTGCHVRITTGASWTGAGSIQVTLVYLRPGHGLGYWQPGHMEPRHRSWKDVQTGPASLYNQTRDFVDATELVPS